MAEFRDAKLWMKLAFLFIMLGFVQELFAIAMGLGNSYVKDSIEACMVIGFLCFLVAVVLGLGLMFLDELAGNKIAQICFIVFALIAGLATVIAVALWGGELNKNNSELPAYSTTVGVCCALCAILAGIFAILDVAGVKSG
ncbi:hypothetical protein CAPTEDRAFT_226296 [Capitella teleta]|uniref:MARVEL domain-containing protein n=1 Tax=Capitella teleta TaxID=283909 RepID=R7TYV5_CAPTE|nr:hypothetical protein CAPTEDRAFT_226296 [Capitella teleta]|eukprot:ELT96606.1 hypothetical protein CAPTEDRAFT_226296 [Capitella teleta]